MNRILLAALVGAAAQAVSAGAFANPTAYSVAPMLQQRDAFADRFWGLLQAPAVATPPATGATPLYDFRDALRGPDPFAQQFYGAGAPAPAPAPQAARPATTAAPVAPAPVAQAQTAPRPAATASGLPAQQPVPVQIVTAQPAPAPAPAPAQGRAAPIASMAAAPASRWYATGNVGLATLSEATNTGADVANEHAYDAGPVFAFAIGNQRTSRLSLEGEFAMRRFGMSTITPAGDTPSTATGTVSTTSLLGNVVWAPEFSVWRLNPYLLAGGGVAHHQMTDVAAAGVSTVNSSDWVLAYQLGFGAEWPLSPRWSIDSSYRYFSTLAPELTDAAGRTFETAVASHNLLVGARYNF